MKSQLSLDPQGRNHIRSVSQEGVRIGDNLYRGALIVAAEAVIGDWAPDSLEALEDDHLDAVLALLIPSRHWRHQRYVTHNNYCMVFAVMSELP